MARTTLIVLFIASLCFISESAPVTPGIINGLINSCRGRSTGTLNSTLGRAISQQNRDITLTSAQRACIAQSAASGRIDGQQKLAQVAQQLALQYQNAPSTATVAEIQADIDAQMNKAVQDAVTSAISKMQSC